MKKEEKEKKSIIARIDDFLLRFSRIKPKEKLFFIQHFKTMFRAGIAIPRTMHTLAQQTENKYFAKVILDIKKRIEGGETLHGSMAAYPKIFDELFVNMIEAGEVSGNLEKILDQLYLQLKKNHELTSKVRNAMIYPAVVFVMMIAVLIFMMVMVVPKIVGIFEGFGTQLPLPTRILIGISNFVQDHGLIVVLGVAFIVVSFIKINRTYKGKKTIQLFFLKFMVIGGIIKKINLARFSRTLSNLLKTDILVEKDFQITSSVLKNLYYREAVKEMSKELQQGTEINKVVEKYPKLFPPVILQMIAVGESSGNLDDMLAQIADFYEKEVEDTMENLPSLIEPLLIIVLGIGVGALAVSIILPIYSLTTTI